MKYEIHIWLSFIPRVGDKLNINTLTIPITDKEFNTLNSGGVLTVESEDATYIISVKRGENAEEDLPMYDYAKVEAKEESEKLTLANLSTEAV